jgi:hypothetical protein
VNAHYTFVFEFGHIRFAFTQAARLLLDVPEKPEGFLWARQPASDELLTSVAF